jgi:hypothetical protein
MRDPSRVCVVGPLAPFQPGFAEELAESGYRRASAALQLRLRLLVRSQPPATDDKR